MTSLVRSAALTGYAELARSIGLDPVRLVRAAAIPVSALTNPDLKIRAASVSQLLEATAARAGLEDFGLRLARQRRLSNLGPIALVLREQATLRQVVEAIMQLVWLQNESLNLHLEEAGDLVILHCRGAGGPLPRQSAELTLGTLVRSVRALLGESWRPTLVCFEHAPPHTRETHRRVFDCDLAFDQDFAGIAIARRDLALKVPNADPVMAREIERYVRPLRGQERARMRDKVLELVLASLASGRSTAERVSNALGFDRRTLHRKLAQEQTSFRQLLHQARLRLLKAYLRDKRRSLTAISELLGFSSLSAFSRWHAQNFGRSATRAAKPRPRLIRS